MGGLIDYYREYAELRLSVSKGKRVYLNDKGLETRWDKEPEAHKVQIEYAFKTHTFKEFKTFLVSNFIVDSKFFIRDIKNEFSLANYRQYRQYTGNVQEYLKQDLRNIVKENSTVPDFLIAMCSAKPCYFLTTYYLWLAGLLKDNIPLDLYNKIMFYNSLKTNFISIDDIIKTYKNVMDN